MSIYTIPYYPNQSNGTPGCHIGDHLHHWAAAEVEVEYTYRVGERATCYEPSTPTELDVEGLALVFYRWERVFSNPVWPDGRGVRHEERRIPLDPSEELAENLGVDFDELWGVAYDVWQDARQADQRHNAHYEEQ